MKIIYRIHAVERMFERGIAPSQVRAVIESGAALENYPDDAAYPARLLLGGAGKRALHVVEAYDDHSGESIIITAYRPDRRRWSADLRRRRDDLPDV